MEKKVEEAEDEEKLKLWQINCQGSSSLASGKENITRPGAKARAVAGVDRVEPAAVDWKPAKGPFEVSTNIYFWPTEWVVPVSAFCFSSVFVFIFFPSLSFFFFFLP